MKNKTQHAKVQSAISMIKRDLRRTNDEKIKLNERISELYVKANPDSRAGSVAFAGLNDTKDELRKILQVEEVLQTLLQIAKKTSKVSCKEQAEAEAARSKIASFSLGYGASLATMAKSLEALGKKMREEEALRKQKAIARAEAEEKAVILREIRRDFVRSMELEARKNIIKSIQDAKARSEQKARADAIAKERYEAERRAVFVEAIKAARIPIEVKNIFLWPVQKEPIAFNFSTSSLVYNPNRIIFNFKP